MTKTSGKASSNKNDKISFETDTNSEKVDTKMYVRFRIGGFFEVIYSK